MHRVQSRSIRRLRGFFLPALFCLAFIACSSTGAVKAPLAPRSFVPDSGPVARHQLAHEVRAAFAHAWDGYKKYAWGYDELKPLSRKGYNWYGRSLFMTPVDAFDTMVLMGLTADAREDKALILGNLSFDEDISVQVFEVTIRLLGGLLSAYELDGDARFLALATDLGNRLLPAFDSKTGMPYRYVNLKTGKTQGDVSNPAEIGTLLLEFGTLSRLSGNPLYYEKARHAIVELYNRRSRIGLVGSSINVNSGRWLDTESHIGGGIDSYYEYLLKGSILFGDAELGAMWSTSIRAVNRYVADRRAFGLFYGHVDMNSGRFRAPLFGALEAYFPAVLALDGELGRAGELEDSCFAMWNLNGLEPEQFDYVTKSVTSPQYILRPEIAESAYYLYHFTQDPKYLRMGRTIFEDINAYCRTDAGFAEITDVRTMQKQDRMQSFFLAETLKYLYLLFAPADTLDFKSVIFNTEAHPLRIDAKVAPR